MCYLPGNANDAFMWRKQMLRMIFQFDALGLIRRSLYEFVGAGNKSGNDAAPCRNDASPFVASTEISMTRWCILFELGINAPVTVMEGMHPPRPLHRALHR